MNKFELNKLTKFTQCCNFVFTVSKCAEQKLKSCGLSFNLSHNIVLARTKVLLYLKLQSILCTCTNTLKLPESSFSIIN